jgi:hypothetical protein
MPSFACLPLQHSASARQSTDPRAVPQSLVGAKRIEAVFSKEIAFSRSLWQKLKPRLSHLKERILLDTIAGIENWLVEYVAIFCSACFIFSHFFFLSWINFVLFPSANSFCRDAIVLRTGGLHELRRACKLCSSLLAKIPMPDNIDYDGFIKVCSLCSVDFY